MKRLLKTFTALSVCVLMTNQNVMGQIMEKSFDVMLDALYSHSVPIISVHELDSLRKKQNIILLDSREKEEFDVSHIESAIYVGYDNFKKNSVKDLPKNQPVIVYCSVGYRSEKIGEQLQKLGFEDVYNLYGGIFKWKNDDKPVLNPAGQITDSVHTYNLIWSQWLWNGKKVY